MSTIPLNANDFQKKVVDYPNLQNEWKYLGDKPAVIDFFATWCGPCKMLSPVLEELSNEYADDIYIYKVDIDQEEKLAELFGIRSVPTLLFVPMKGQPQMLAGALPKSELKNIIDDVLLNSTKKP